MGNKVIETGIDKLVSLVNKKERISIEKAARELGVVKGLIEEWADFLDMEGLISVEYHLSDTFLVRRKLTKKEAKIKNKDLDDERDIFIRDVENTIASLDTQTKSIAGLKDEFLNLRKAIGNDLDNVKEELWELDNYEKLKKDIDKNIAEYQKQYRKKIDDMEKNLVEEEEKYDDILHKVFEEKVKIKKEKKELLELKKQELRMLEKLDDFKNLSREIRETIQTEDDLIDLTEKHIEKLEKTAANIDHEIKDHDFSKIKFDENGKAIEGRQLDSSRGFFGRFIGGGKEDKKMDLPPMPNERPANISKPSKAKHDKHSNHKEEKLKDISIEVKDLKRPRSRNKVNHETKHKDKVETQLESKKETKSLSERFAKSKAAKKHISSNLKQSESEEQKKKIEYENNKKVVESNTDVVNPSNENKSGLLAKIKGIFAKKEKKCESENLEPSKINEDLVVEKKIKARLADSHINKKKDRLEAKHSQEVALDKISDNNTNLLKSSNKIDSKRQDRIINTEDLKQRILANTIKTKEKVKLNSTTNTNYQYVRKDLIGFVSSALGSGFKRDQIKEKLIEKGWPSHIVEATLDFAINQRM